MKLLFTLTTVILLTGACSETKNHPTLQIPAEAPVDAQAEPVELSKIAKNIRIIPLETTPQCLISSVKSFTVTDKNIYVNNNGKSCLLFTRDGKFVSPVGSNGRGPNEYLNVENIWIQGDKAVIFDIYANNLLMYDRAGKFILSAKPEGYLKNNLTALELLPDGNIVTFSPDKGPAPKRAMLAFASLPENGNEFKLLDSIPHPKPIAEQANINWYFREGQFIQRGKEVLFKSTLNDTIYKLKRTEGKYIIIPQYIFNLGKYAAINDARVQTYKGFFSSKPFKAFNIMAQIELLGDSDRYIFYKVKDEPYYFYDKKKNQVNKWQIIPQGKEEECKDNPNYFTPLCIDSNGNLLGVMQSEKEEDNPVLVIAELR